MRRKSAAAAALPILATALWMLACGINGAEPQVIAPQTGRPTGEYIETGDMDRLAARGKIRILVPPQLEKPYLPRGGSPLDSERSMARAFVRETGLQPKIVQVEEYKDLIPWLLEGRGDVIAASYTITPKRARLVDFSDPIRSVVEQVICRDDDAAIKAPEDLKNRIIAVRRSSSYWDSVISLQKKYPGFFIEAAPERLDSEEIIYGIARGDYDITVADSNLAQAVFSYRSDLRIAFNLTKSRNIAWAVRQNSPKLLAAINSFIATSAVGHQHTDMYRADMPEIKERKLLRVLTRNSAATYYLWRGKLQGFDYALARKFATGQKVRLEMIVPPDRNQLIDWLLEGRGDVIAASMSVTDNRRARGVAFSDPYNYVDEVLVARTEDPLASLADLNGRRIVLCRNSSHWDTVSDLVRQGYGIDLEAAPDDMEPEDLIDGVANGTYDLTVADSNILEIEDMMRDDVRAALTLRKDVPVAFAVRAADTRLLHELNRYVRRSYRGMFYNMTKKKYFSNKRQIKRRVPARTRNTGQISPWDDTVRRYAQRYGFDWRLMVAQMYYESKFNPRAESSMGAKGLMQVLPKTYRSLGFREVTTPEKGIWAGIRYMSILRDRFEADVPATERTWMAMASYNAGYGHVLDARRLAEQLGLNPNRWDDNVEKAMLMLRYSRYARRARFGYVRGDRPVKYVNEIRKLYNAYAETVPR